MYFSGHQSASLPVSSSRMSMAGCVEIVSISLDGNEQTFDPTKYGSTSSGLTYGCLNWGAYSCGCDYIVDSWCFCYFYLIYAFNLQQQLHLQIMVIPNKT